MHAGFQAVGASRQEIRNRPDIGAHDLYSRTPIRRQPALRDRCQATPKATIFIEPAAFPGRSPSDQEKDLNAPREEGATPIFYPPQEITITSGLLSPGDTLLPLSQPPGIDFKRWVWPEITSGRYAHCAGWMMAGNLG